LSKMEWNYSKDILRKASRSTCWVHIVPLMGRWRVYSSFCHKERVKLLLL
jgi:hypothetical protein